MRLFITKEGPDIYRCVTLEELELPENKDLVFEEVLTPADQEKCLHFNRMPSDVMGEIFKHLDIQDRINLNQLGGAVPEELAQYRPQFTKMELEGALAEIIRCDTARMFQKHYDATLGKTSPKNFSKMKEREILDYLEYLSNEDLYALAVGARESGMICKALKVFRPIGENLDGIESFVNRWSGGEYFNFLKRKHIIGTGMPILWEDAQFSTLGVVIDYLWTLPVEKYRQFAKDFLEYADKVEKNKYDDDYYDDW